jgi:hypothetical protein
MNMRRWMRSPLLITGENEAARVVSQLCDLRGIPFCVAAMKQPDRGLVNARAVLDQYRPWAVVNTMAGASIDLTIACAERDTVLLDLATDPDLASGPFRGQHEPPDVHDAARRLNLRADVYRRLNDALDSLIDESHAAGFTPRAAPDAISMT